MNTVIKMSIQRMVCTGCGAGGMRGYLIACMQRR
jgi:hypothetical protein